MDFQLNLNIGIVKFRHFHETQDKKIIIMLNFDIGRAEKT